MFVTGPLRRQITRTCSGVPALSTTSVSDPARLAARKRAWLGLATPFGRTPRGRPHSPKELPPGVPVPRNSQAAPCPIPVVPPPGRPVALRKACWRQPPAQSKTDPDSRHAGSPFSRRRRSNNTQHQLAYAIAGRVAGLPGRVNPNNGHVGILLGMGTRMAEDGSAILTRGCPTAATTGAGGGWLCATIAGSGCTPEPSPANHDRPGKTIKSAAAAKAQAIRTSRQVLAARTRRWIRSDEQRTGRAPARVRAFSTAWSMRPLLLLLSAALGAAGQVALEGRGLFAESQPSRYSSSCSHSGLFIEAKLNSRSTLPARSQSHLASSPVLPNRSRIRPAGQREARLDRIRADAEHLGDLPHRKLLPCMKVQYFPLPGRKRSMASTTRSWSSRAISLAVGRHRRGPAGRRQRRRGPAAVACAGGADRAKGWRRS